MLSSDGRFVYAVAELPESTVEEEEGAMQADSLPTGLGVSSRNQLLALFVDRPVSADRRVAWVNDGLVPQRSGAAKKLVTFLGPPLPGTTE